MKQKYKNFKGKWYAEGNNVSKEDDEIKYFTDKEAMLLNLDKDTRERILKRNNRKTQPILIIIDGVDGVGKTTIVENIRKRIEAQKFKVIFNTFKRRRNDKEIFKTPDIKYEWMFRKEVVEQINRRMITYTNEDIIIIDKSPYCEYFYQRTNSFDRGIITSYGNFKMEQEIFKYKDIIDNAIVIFLENDKCWENYIGREMKKGNDGHKASYETLKENEYMEMVRSFKENQKIYESKKKYKEVKIYNDDKSWKIVYNEILKIIKNGS